MEQLCKRDLDKQDAIWTSLLLRVPGTTFGRLGELLIKASSHGHVEITMLAGKRLRYQNLEISGNKVEYLPEYCSFRNRTVSDFRFSSLNTVKNVTYGVESSRKTGIMT